MTSRYALAAALGVPTILLGGLTAFLLLLQPPPAAGACGADASGEPLGPVAGNLGAVAGTGLTRADIDTVRRHPLAGAKLTAGSYLSTSYGPPWGGLNGSGVATAGGVQLNKGAPSRYFISVDPAVISLGKWVYAWPNPFGWRGPFLAADTGNGILGQHIDFYDWRGREPQLAWGRTEVRVSARPSFGDLDDPAAALTAPVVAASESCAAGDAVLSSDVGERIGQIARSYIGKDARAAPLAGLPDPGPVSLAWCAFFQTNVWKKAGVPIDVSFASFWAYTWAQSKRLLFKAVGQVPAGRTPPVGAALMYGSGPSSTSTSEHVNLVDAVNPDGSFMVTGGNQGNSIVSRYGPCRLTVEVTARLQGPGCDGRPVYGIAAPYDWRTGTSPDDERAGAAGRRRSAATPSREGRV